MHFYQVQPGQFVQKVKNAAIQISVLSWKLLEIVIERTVVNNCLYKKTLRWRLKKLASDLRGKLGF